MPAPSLSVAALTHQLARMFAGGRKHRPLIAIHGTCEDPRPIDLPGVGRFEVVLADSELTLRRLLPGPTEPASRTVYLVPWTHHLPLDVAGRFVHDGRVFHIDAEVRLSRLFTAPFETIDSDVPSSKLAAWLLREPPSAPLPSPGGRLTRDALWDAWLRHQWGIDLGEGGLSGLLAWAASNGLGPRMAAALATDVAAGVQAEFEALLVRRLGEPAPAIVRAWLRERGSNLLGFAVLCETLAPRAEDDRAVRTWLALKAETFLGSLPAPRQQQLLRRLGALVPPTFGELGRTDQRSVLRAALDAAELLADDHVRGPLIDSTRLLSSWQQRLAALGDVLSEAAPRPSHDHLQRAVAALRSLEQHERPRYSRDGRAAAELARAEAGVRLLAWLVARDIHALALQNRSERAEGLARWYVEEGGYLDSARQTAREAGDDRLGVGISAVLARVDAERRDLDRKFADGLAAWYASRNRIPRAVPIAEAIDKIAVRFLKARPERRLLTILLDGMAWTQAVELLASLDDDASRWAPLVWHAHDGKIGEGPYPSVFAAIPSITQLSRSAFFAGKSMPPGSLPSTGGDPKRLAEHRGLKNLLPGVTAPPLFLRGALDDNGSAGSEVLAQIRDPRMRFVGVVVNAIDSSLGSDPQQSATWRARDIGPLFDLLDAAQAAGRAVLLASDHGHVPGDRLQYTGKQVTKAAPRWRPWSDDRPIQDYETLFPADDTWGPRDSKGVIVINDEEHRYTPSSAHTGEHGGATLAEVIAPTILIGWENMAVEFGDEALAVRAAAPPRWWHLHVDRPPPREPRPPRPTRKEPSPQLVFAGVTPPEPTTAAAPPPSDPLEHPLVRRLVVSPIFAARATDPGQRDIATRAVAALLANGRSAPDTILGPALGLHARRVGGYIIKASEVLNVDGYAVLQFDPINHRAELHVDRMIQCFELEPL